MSSGEVRTSRFRISQSKIFDTDSIRRYLDPLEKLAMVTRAILTEVFKDSCQWCLRHRDLEKVVTEWNL